MVVHIENTDTFGDDSVRMVADAAWLFLAPIARQESHRLEVLHDNQRLVPIEFVIERGFDCGMRLALPAELELRGPRLVSIVTGPASEPQEVLARTFLRQALEMTLDIFPEVIEVRVWRANTALARISVKFARLQGVPDAATLSAIQQDIMQVIARHVQLAPGAHLYGDLVFAGHTVDALGYDAR